jgi:hypothetical protein
MRDHGFEATRGSRQLQTEMSAAQEATEGIITLHRTSLMRLVAISIVRAEFQRNGAPHSNQKTARHPMSTEAQRWWERPVAIESYGRMRSR